jgi:hypothetical protein
MERPVFRRFADFRDFPGRPRSSKNCVFRKSGAGRGGWPTSKRLAGGCNRRGCCASLAAWPCPFLFTVGCCCRPSSCSPWRWLAMWRPPPPMCRRTTAPYRFARTRPRGPTPHVKTTSPRSWRDLCQPHSRGRPTRSDLLVSYTCLTMGLLFSCYFRSTHHWVLGVVGFPLGFCAAAAVYGLLADVAVRCGYTRMRRSTDATRTNGWGRPR